VWLVQYRFQSKYPNQFKNRALLPPREQLIAHDFDGRSIDDAISIWNEVAQAYQIDPMQLRVNDKVSDIVSRDWFGDSGLEIEAKLTAAGCVPISDNATLCDLITFMIKK
jgi:hypothetical protein